MIAGLSGVIKIRGTDRVIVDVHGVYYECMASLNTLDHIGEPGDQVELVAYTHVREDALKLYGFADYHEKRIFLELISVSGIGPKLALNILSGIPAEEFGRAVVSSDIARLTSLPGVGKRTAERIVVELKERLGKILDLVPEDVRAAVRFVAEDELISALANLGYKSKIIEKVIIKIAKKFPPDTRVEDLIRAALREMQK